MKCIFALFFTVMSASALHASSTSVPCDSEYAVTTDSRIIKIDTTKITYKDLANLFALLRTGNDINLDAVGSGNHHKPYINLVVKPQSHFDVFLIALENLERLVGKGVEVQCESRDDAIPFPSVSGGTR